MFRFTRSLPILTQYCSLHIPRYSVRAFSRRKANTLNSDVWTDINKMPTSESYKLRQKEKRRILLQEGEDEDTEVIFWDDSIRPEDLMEGEDLDAYYRSERNLYLHDTSSTDKEQRKMVKEMSKILGVNPEDLPGYNTFFVENQDLSSGIPKDIKQYFDYFEKLMKDHPELQPDFNKWQANLDKVASVDVSKLSNKEFAELTTCPDSILSVVDKAHLPLFQVHKSDFMAESPKKSSKTAKPSSQSSQPSQNHQNKEKSKKQSSQKVQKSPLSTKVEYTLNLMFDSIWNQQPPVSISYISNSTKLQDFYVYITMKEDSEVDEETVLAVLNKNKDCFDDMMKVLLAIDSTPNIIFRFVHPSDS